MHGEAIEGGRQVTQTPQSILATTDGGGGDSGWLVTKQGKTAINPWRR
jgi:hypothetical protein